MKKIYKLKKWYSLSDAASRLSLTLGEDISKEEVLELALDGELSLFWNVRHLYALEVEFTVKSIPLILNDPPCFGEGPADEDSACFDAVGIFAVEGQNAVTNLSGPHRLLLKQCGALEDYFRSFMTQTGGDLISLDGFFLEGDDGRIWQPQESFGGEYIKRLNEDKAARLYDVCRYFPSNKWPDLNEVGFPRVEIEKFEARFLPNRPDAVGARERQTLYKIIIGMAVDAYGYAPSSMRSPFPKELEGILDRLGVPVSDDTIRKKIAEASEFLPSSDTG